MKVLKFGAIWCSGCLVMKPRWQKIEKEHPVFESEYYEYDDCPGKIKKYGIEEGSLPTFIFLDKKGNELERVTGEISEKKILELVEKYKSK
ncbi:hypothetical protein GF360_00150 [candidate division WWE3 bacterium]|nr:hypothetical protein [candidate division WWE3 bacterium]